MITITVRTKDNSIGVMIDRENEQFIIYMSTMFTQAYEYGKFLHEIIPNSKLVWAIVIENIDQEVTEEVWKAWSL